MSPISDKKNNDWVRKFYEPLYGRQLSDGEVEEIEINLKSFAVAILSIAGQIKRQSSTKLNAYECSTHQ